MAFMELMNRVFQDYLDPFVIMLVDDIFIYSKNENKHEHYLRLVVQVLKEHQLYPNIIKCEFWLRSVSFLGLIMSGELLEFDPKKMDVVKNWPRLLTPSNIRTF